jgi:TRAP-type C4-dicarboxylate transport system substrate-binding protein
MKRREFLKMTAAGAVAGLPLGSAYAQKAAFSYKDANNLPVTHPMNIRAKEMVDAIRAETKGRGDIQVFPNSLKSPNKRAMRSPPGSPQRI